MVFLFFPAAAIIGFLVHAAISRKPRSAERLLDLLLRWSFGLALGASFVFGFTGHIFDARQVADQIGFPAGNPFQWEVGWAGLALGVISLIGVWRRDFWWPSAIAAAIFGWGAAWGHVYQMVVNGNHHPDNSGPILYTDVLVPLAVLVLLVVRTVIASGTRAAEPAQAPVGRPAGQQG